MVIIQQDVVLSLSRQLSEQAKYLSEEANFNQVSKKCKRIGLQFNRILQHIFTAANPNEQIRKELNSIARSFQVILSSLKYEINGPVFAMLKYLSNKYYQLANSRPYAINPNSVLKRQQINQLSNLYKSYSFEEINNNETQFIQSQQINHFFINVAESKIVLINNQCIFCSKVFIKNTQLRNSNPFFKNVVALTQKQASNKINLQKNICALFNAGGGALVVGAEKMGPDLQVAGLKFKHFNEVIQRKQQIIQVIQYIKPKYGVEYSVQHVLVHHNRLKGENPAEEYLRFCFRIAIIPQWRDRIKYIQISNKGFHTLYEVYKYNVNYDPIKVLFVDKGQNLYSMMFQNYWKHHTLKKHGNNIQNSHPCILCYLPHDQYSQELLQYTSKGQNILEQDNSINKNQQEQQEQLKLPYTNATILVVGSKNKDRFIKDLNSFMNSKKYMFQLSKPFQNEFKVGLRSIWLLSHADKIEVIKNCIKQCDNTGNITAIPIYKTIQIDRSKLSFDNEKQIRQRFCKKFNQFSYNFSEIQKTDLNGDKKRTVNITVDSYSQVVYAYMIFQSLQLRPYLVKQNTSYKKKSKIKAS